jgi:hypothetical protein
MALSTTPPNAQDLRLIHKHILNHLGINAEDLVHEYPPRFHNRNKRLVYDLTCPRGAPSHHGRLEYTRWKQFDLPETIAVGEVHTEVVDGFFTYAPPPPPEQESHWHLNFADRYVYSSATTGNEHSGIHSHVFAFYGGSLFAQDEMQCSEHPALCSLRDLLVHLTAINKSSLLDPTRTSITFPDQIIATPILVSGVERRAHVRTDRNAAEGRPQGLYGNNFAVASEGALRRAVEALDTRLDAQGKPYFSNILAMVAPREVSYSKDVVRMTLATAYTGFMAAKMESLVNAGFLVRSHDELGEHTKLADPMPSRPVPQVKIHTGNWGCGAFGGNPVVMAMLQTLAAQIAGVELIYYIQGAANKSEYDCGVQDLWDLIGRLAVNGHVDCEAFLDGVVKKEYMWGESNGT